LQWFDRWFIVCHAGIDATTCEQFEDYLQQCERDKKTFKEVFSENNRIVNRYRMLCRRNRRRLICKVANAFKTFVGQRKDEHAVPDEDIQATISSVDIETESNTVKQVGKCHVLYNASCSTLDAQGGIIVNRAPQFGPIVCKGPTNSTMSNRLFNGSPWTNELYNAFPTDCGRLSAKTNLRTYPDMFICENDDNSAPKRVQAMYRPRDEQWIKMEKRLGFLSDNWAPPVELQPFAVKMSRE
jgi:hypothetical protein